VLRCAFGSIYFRSSMSRALDVMPVRLDGYPSQPERGHGDRNVVLFIVALVAFDDKLYTFRYHVDWPGGENRMTVVGILSGAELSKVMGTEI
jgi:hypothetical protein